MSGQPASRSCTNIEKRQTRERILSNIKYERIVQFCQFLSVNTRIKCARHKFPSPELMLKGSHP